MNVRSCFFIKTPKEFLNSKAKLEGIEENGRKFNTPQAVFHLSREQLNTH